MTDTEPFPDLPELPELREPVGIPMREAPREQLHPLNTADDAIRPKPRRKSSGLGGEIRAGDTGAPAVATLDIVAESPQSRVSPLHY